METSKKSHLTEMTDNEVLRFELSTSDFCALYGAHLTQHALERMSPEDRSIAQNHLVNAKHCSFISAMCYHDLKGIRNKFKFRAKLVHQTSKQISLDVSIKGEEVIRFVIPHHASYIKGSELNTAYEYALHHESLPDEEVIIDDVLVDMFQLNSTYEIRGAIRERELNKQNILEELSSKIIICPIFKWCDRPLVMVVNSTFRKILTLYFYDANHISTADVIREEVPSTAEGWNHVSFKTSYRKQRQREELFEKIRFRGTHAFIGDESGDESISVSYDFPNYKKKWALFEKEIEKILEKKSFGNSIIPVKEKKGEVKSGYKKEYRKDYKKDRVQWRLFDQGEISDAEEYSETDVSSTLNNKQSTSLGSAAESISKSSRSSYEILVKELKSRDLHLPFTDEELVRFAPVFDKLKASEERHADKQRDSSRVSLALGGGRFDMLRMGDSSDDSSDDDF